MLFDNEEEIIEQNEQNNEDLEKKMALFGYTEYETEYFDTKEFDKLKIEFIKNKTPKIYDYKLMPRKTKFIKDLATKMLLEQIDNIDRKVLYINEDSRAYYDFKAIYEEEKETYEYLIKTIKRIAKKRDITNLPIKWQLGTGRNALVNTLLPFSQDLNILDKFPIVCTGIEMINENDDLAVTVLVHEMTHALLNRNKGIISNAMHDEILSIYMELLTAFEMDETGTVYNKALLSRLQNLKDIIIGYIDSEFNGLEIKEGENYIISSLYAFNILDIYQNSSQKKRNAIKREIQKTLSGERLLEETLDILEANEKDGSKIIRKHLKII